MVGVTGLKLGGRRLTTAAVSVSFSGFKSCQNVQTQTHFTQLALWLSSCYQRGWEEEVQGSAVTPSVWHYDGISTINLLLKPCSTSDIEAYFMIEDESCVDLHAEPRFVRFQEESHPSVRFNIKKCFNNREDSITFIKCLVEMCALQLFVVFTCLQRNIREC